MQVIHSPDHELHAPQSFISSGRVMASPECPERAARLIAAVEAAGHAVSPPERFPDRAVAAVHSVDYLEFLQTAYERWQALPAKGPEVQANTHPGRHMTHRPAHVVGQAGYHMADAACPIGPGTWRAARTAADIALTAARQVFDGEQVAYALCRPPGHHAYGDMAGGFCFLNNVAIAAEWLRQQGRWPAILDIDVHHGNGTQGIFYRRADVLFVSVHADPTNFYPYFAGYADERGEAGGLGRTINLPLPHGSRDEPWLAAVTSGLDVVRSFGADVLLVSLGLDPQENDPLGVLKVSTDGFRRAGTAIARFGLPAVIVQEGGYLCDELAANLAAFLGGCEAG